ncbi:MAG TPA: response regulator, partial [Niastella sp.]|nr:response regulator [Niastella sp.]
PTILFVDDDKDDEQIIRGGLEKLNFWRFEFCPDGNGALAHLATLTDKELPDLVVSDLQLPIFDGLELAKALKADSRYVEIAVVIYSGRLSPAIKLKLHEAGVTEMFEKPTNIEDVIQILTGLIKLATEHHIKQKEIR